MHRFLLGAAVAVFACTLAAPCRAADLRVPADFSSLADALAAATAGDQVILSPGIHTAFNVDLVGGVTIVGDPDAPDRVVLSAGGQGRVLRAESLDLPAILIGLTLSDGRADGTNSYDASGGGLLVSRAEVRLEDCRLVDNHAAGSGGSLRVAHGDVVLVRCELSGNSAGKGGGGMDVSYGASGDALDCTFADNESAWGGGVAVRATSDAALRRCRLVSNRSLTGPGLGGGLACDLGAAPLLNQTLIADNVARHGAGLYVASDAAPELHLVTMDGNEAEEAGGGIYCRDATTSLDRSIISNNVGAAVTCPGDDQLTVTGSVIHGNSGGDWTGQLAARLGVDGNLNVDPLFCGADDRHLQDGSPCAPENSPVGLVGALGVDCASAVDVPGAHGAVTFRIQPNPFNPRTEIVYSLPADGPVRLTIVDLRGRQLARLVDEYLPQGEHRVRWEARDDQGRQLPSGTYLMVLETGGQRVTSKLALLK